MTELDPLDLLELDVDTRLAVLWAEIDGCGFDEVSLPLVASLIRSAFAFGYVAALEEPVRGELCRAHGYEVPRRRGV